MAGDGNYLAEMLQAGQPGTPNAIDNLNKGMQFGQNVQNIPMQNMYRQQKMQEMEKQKQVEAAIKQYGQTGDIKTLQALDPAMAMQVDKASEYFKSQPPESIKAMTRVADQFERIGPMVNKDNWAGPQGVRARTMAANPGLPPDSLPPDNATPDQIYKFVNAVPLFKATLKAAGQPGKIAGGYYMPPGGGAPQELPPTAKDQSVIAKNIADVEHKRDLTKKYGAEIELKIADLGIKQAKLDWDKIKPGKAGAAYNEAAAYDKAVTAANKVLSDDQVVRDAANKQLASQDPNWGKLPIEDKRIAREKIMPQVREELKKHLVDSYMNERRQKAGVGGAAKGGGLSLPTQYMGKYGTDSNGNNIVWDGKKYVPYAGVGGGVGGGQSEEEEEGD